MTKYLAIALVVVTLVGATGTLWYRGQWLGEVADAADRVAKAQKAVRDEVTAAAAADVAALGRERDAALSRIRALEITKRSLTNAPGATDLLPDGDPFDRLIDSVREPAGKR